jgi:hypothetical protein
MKRLEKVASRVCGVVGAAWFASFLCLWVLKPVPRSLEHLSFVLLAALGAVFLVTWALSWLNVYAEADEEGRTVEEVVHERETPGARRLAMVGWWCGLSIFAYVGLDTLTGRRYRVAPRDVVTNPGVITHIVVSLVIGACLTKLLFMAADRGWVE